MSEEKTLPKNMMQWSVKQLEEKAAEMEIDLSFYRNDKDQLNRKEVANQIKLRELAAGVVKEPAIVTDEGEVTKPTKIRKGYSGMMVHVVFYNTDENDLPYVQLGLNGDALYIPREKEVWIPQEFIKGVLAPAVMTRLKQHISQNGKITYIPKQVQRFSYTVLDMKQIDDIPKEG